MDYDKLIERLGENTDCWTDKVHGYADLRLEAATALSTLQAENKRLNKIVCSIPTTPDSGRTVSQYDKEMSMCAYLDDLEAENEKLRAELEQVKSEKAVALEYLHGICSACKNYSPYHNRGKCRYCAYEPARDKDAEANDNWEWRGIKED